MTYQHRQSPTNPGYYQPQNPGYYQPQNPGHYQPQTQNPYPQNAADLNSSNSDSPSNYGRNPHYAEGGMPKSEMGFADKTIRAAFIRKVFAIVAVMLGVVTIMTSIPFMYPEMMKFVKQNPWMTFLSYGVFLAVYLALMCCENVRRTFPLNVIMTAILTLSVGFMTMMITARYEVSSVLMCFGITTVCCIGIVIFACQTKYDITSCIGWIAIASLVLLVFGLLVMLFAFVLPAKQFRIIHVVYAGVSALLFMVYLAFDIQTIMGGRQIELSPEEYIFGAIQVFMDVVILFWQMLVLFGTRGLSNDD